MRIKLTWLLFFVFFSINAQIPYAFTDPLSGSFKIISGVTSHSFLVLAKASRSIEFNKGMRITGENNPFFKPEKTSKSALLEKHRLWLNMTNSGGAFKQLLIGYIEGATNGLDSDFDGISLDANPYLDFYSINSESNLVIQGRVLPFTDKDEVPLGYRTILTGYFTISIDHADGLLENQAVFIEDKFTHTIHDLRLSDYTFNTVSGTFRNRFVLKYTNKIIIIK
ncbi:hypothetical protein [Flavobacterium sp.]|uniref:hypothetical protein n=1 Tax=Flavobacterium sp. TaxID=239 RepID=UPI003264AA2B